MEEDRGVLKNHIVEEMMQKTLHSVDDAITALEKGDEKALDANVWKAAFYLEYVTFHLSLLRRKGNDPWKTKKRNSTADIKTTLLGVQDLVQKALVCRSREERYHETWIARGYILGIQRRLHRRKAKKAMP
jgi:hypothetical protein